MTAAGVPVMTGINIEAEFEYAAWGANNTLTDNLFQCVVDRDAEPLKQGYDDAL